MFSLFTGKTPREETFAPGITAPKPPPGSSGLNRTNTVKPGIKAEQERSDILQEQIILLSEKAAHAYDKVAETEAENKRLLENIKNLELLLKEKAHLSKRKTSNQELLDLKIANNELNDKILSQNIENTRLVKENKTVKQVNGSLVSKANAMEKVHKELQVKNRELQAENFELHKASQANFNSQSLHERDDSVTSVSSHASTVFSFTRNSSTDDVNTQILTPVSASTNTHDIISDLNKKVVALKKETDYLQAKLAEEKQKRSSIVNNFRSFQEKNSILAKFNTDYIQQLTDKIEYYKKNETLLKSKIDLIQSNADIFQANQQSMYSI